MRIALVDTLTLNRAATDRGHALIVEDDIAASADLETQLLNMGFRVLLSRSGKQAITLLEENAVELVFMKTLLPDMHTSELIRHIKKNSAEYHVAVVLLVSEPGDEMLLDCMAAGGDDFLLYRFTPVLLAACIAAMEQLRKLRHLYKSSVHEQVIAKQILSAALSARTIDVNEMQILSRSAAIFSGDLVLSARKPDGGLHILLADFTGHGLSAAIGVLPVADMFSVMTEKGFGPEKIVKNINKKLHTLLPISMFMSACILEIDRNISNASVCNSGMPDVYLLDGKSGKIKHRIKSTHIPLGINRDIDNRLEHEVFDIQSGDQFIMHSDGLTDIVDSSGVMFGVSRLVQLMENAGQDDTVFNEIASAFDQFCDDQDLSDDVTLVSVPCGRNLMQSTSTDVEINRHDNNNNKKRRGNRVEVIVDDQLHPGIKA